MKVDVLNLEYTSVPSRDRETASLVCGYLRYKGYKVVENSIFNGYQSLKKNKPKILFMSNTTGSKLNQQVARYAKKKGIIVIALISEGNIKHEFLSQMTWGHNEKKIHFEDAYLIWNKKSYDMIVNNYPKLKKL